MKFWKDLIILTSSIMNRASSHSLFTQKVIQVVQVIPYGRVVSYGQVAAYIGVPRAARQVGWILRSNGAKVSMPWWRVVNKSGRLSIQGNLYADKSLQKKLLENEGVIVSGDYFLDIEKYRFTANMELLNKWELPVEYRDTVMEKYGV